MAKGDRAELALLGKEGGASNNKKVIIIILVSLVVVAVVVGVSLGIFYGSTKKIDVSKSLSVNNIMGHLQKLNNLANSPGNNGSRSIVDAYNASAEYVEARLKATGDFCNLQRQYFTVPVYVQLAPPTLSQTSPLAISYVLGRDFSGTRYGGNGTCDIEAEAVVASNSGCNFPDDFLGGNLTGNLVVIFDGNCTQYQKALNAEMANAAAVLIVNAQGNSLANWRVRSLGWNESTPLVQIPVLGLTYSLGLTLQAQQGTKLHITTSTVVTIEETFNVLCLTKKGSSSSILVMGAHLDSVPEGPGINDNGSGSSSVLEVALEIERTGLDLKNKILFAWWGAEEIGLLGSRYFVGRLVAQTDTSTLPPFSQSDYLPSLSANNTLLGLNFDMLGSPNFVRQVYNSSAQTPAVNEGTFRIQKIFEEFFIARGNVYQIVPMGGGSDYLPFIENGFPAGALATGAGALKTVAERDLFGGLANAAYDPCYHQSCDTTANINLGVLEDMSKAAAYVVQKLARESNLRSFLYA